MKPLMACAGNVFVLCLLVSIHSALHRAADGTFYKLFGFALRILQENEVLHSDDWTNLLSITFIHSKRFFFTAS